MAPREPFEHVAHGVRRADPYHWMRRLDAGVLAHLESERRWYDVATSHLGPLVNRLRAEMTGRVPATDSSISWPQHGYSYYTVLPAGREYTQLLRRRLDAPDAAPEPADGSARPGPLPLPGPGGRDYAGQGEVASAAAGDTGGVPVEIEPAGETGSEFVPRESDEEGMLFGTLVVDLYDPSQSLFDRESDAEPTRDWWSTVAAMRMKRELRREARQQRREERRRFVEDLRRIRDRAEELAH